MLLAAFTEAVFTFPSFFSDLSSLGFSVLEAGFFYSGLSGMVLAMNVGYKKVLFKAYLYNIFLQFLEQQCFNVFKQSSQAKNLLSQVVSLQLW